MGSINVFIKVAVFYQTVLVSWTIIVSSLILLCLVIVFSSKILPAFLKIILNTTQVSSFETYVETGYEYARILLYHVRLFYNGDRTVPHVLHKLAGFRSHLLDPKKIIKSTAKVKIYFGWIPKFTFDFRLKYPKPAVILL